MSEPQTIADKSAYESLSRGDRGLVDEYLRNGMVQWKAYRDTIGRSDNYNTLRTNSSVKFADPNISAAIDERLREVAMSADEALARLAEQARNVQMRYLRPDGTINLEALIEDGKAHLVSGTDFKGSSGDVLVVKFHDAQSALDKILRAHGAYGAKGTEDSPFHHEHNLGWADGPPDE